MVMVSTSLNFYYYCDYFGDYHEGAGGCWHGNGMNLEAVMMIVMYDFLNITRKRLKNLQHII